ncbi:MAG: acyltransferase [Bryobacterales bacterium]|nr:acyltransferase [Bryobacterales bacterium]
MNNITLAMCFEMSYIESLWFRGRYGLASRLRIALLRSFGMTIGERCRFEKLRIRRPRQIAVGDWNAFTEGTWLWPTDLDSDHVRIQIGDHNYFNRGVMIEATNRIEIGSHNMFGPGVYITDANHTLHPSRWVWECPMDSGTVRIGDGCWLGARVVILKDVTLGDRCVVGAGAVVTKSYPAGSVIAGVPAKLITSDILSGRSFRHERPELRSDADIIRMFHQEH